MLSQPLGTSLDGSLWELQPLGAVGTQDPLPAELLGFVWLFNLIALGTITC